jgi:magnesium-transporting ATPase (P-type)
MKKLVALYCFGYGCVGSLAFLVWHLAALLGHPVLPTSVWTVEAIFLLHGSAMLATFRPNLMGVPTEPVLAVTRKRRLLARLLLGLVTLYFVVFLTIFVWAELKGDSSLGVGMIPLLLTSFALLNTVYIALHWAFRPENILPERLLRIASNPASLVGIGSKWRNRHK